MRKALVYIFLSLLLTATLASAKVFVDWRGNFKIDYPDHWSKVPYEEVNYFLAKRGIDPEVFDFDAVLAEKGDSTFFEGPYIFIMIEEVGNIGPDRIDSTLRGIAGEFGLNSVERGRVFDRKDTLLDNRPVYDSRTRTVLAKSTIKGADGETMVLLDFRKLYKDGIAVFLCHTSIEDYPENSKIFFNAIKSFSTENLHEDAPKESLKVVDLAEPEDTLPDTDSINYAAEAEEYEGAPEEVESNYEIIIIIIAVIVLIVVFIVMIKTKKKEQ